MEVLEWRVHLAGLNTVLVEVGALAKPGEAPIRRYDQRAAGEPLSCGGLAVGSLIT